MRKIVCMCAAGLSAVSWAGLTVNLQWADHAVVQSGKTLVVRGVGGSYHRLSCTFAGKKVWTHDLASEGFRFSFPPLPPGGPYDLVVSNEFTGATVTVRDILVGDVWVAAGQSNMQWSLKDSKPGFGDGTNAWLRIFRESKWRLGSAKDLADVSGIGSYFGKALQQARGVPVGILDVSVGGTAAGCWMSRGAVLACPPLKDWVEDFDNHQGDPDRWAFVPDFELDPQQLEARKKDPNLKQPQIPPRRTYRWGVHCNLMPTRWHDRWVKPLVELPVTGVLWYQGETEAMGRTLAPRYGDILSALIADWRHEWGDPSLPFCVIQLANYRLEDKFGFDPESAWARIRDEQLAVSRRVKNVGLVSAIDVGESHNIHPADKQTVGERLCNWALIEVYKAKHGFSMGPRFLAGSVEGGKVRLAFTDAAGGLVRAVEKESGCKVRGKDGVWHDAVAEIGKSLRLKVDGEKDVEVAELIVSSPDVAEPVEVRYAWDNDPVTIFRNKAGYPMSPFCWPGFK